MPWYQEWFGRDEYELVYDDRDERDAHHLIDLLERTVTPSSEARILDVGCGRGRHARVLARRGYHVTGIDLSERVLEQARQRTKAEGLNIRFCQGDMREAVCEACFDGAVNLFTAFGYFEEDRDHLRSIQAMATALDDGGWLFQDFLNAPHVAESLVPEDHRVVDGFDITQQRWIEDGRINKCIVLRANGREKTFLESVRLLTLDDFRAFYDAADLDLVQTFGDYDGCPHTPESPRLILYARKR